MPARYIVVDVDIPEFMEDRVLDGAHMSRFHGGSVYTRLVEQARARGWVVTTADRFLSARPPFQSAVTLSNEFTPFLEPLLALGVRPGLLWSGESPNVVPHFYRSLPRRSAPFRHACLFRGCLSRLHPGVTRHPLFWPVPRGVHETDLPWGERRLLGMVAAFKGVWGGPRSMVRGVPRAIQGAAARAVQPTLRFDDLYGARMERVRQFAPEDRFVLRGMGWDRTMPGRSPWWRRPIRYANDPTPCDDKLEVLAGCRFGLTIENAAYPGYVTEKIFDTLRAGTVPLYLGAPDIADFVPEECFVDHRRFPSPREAWDHLASMPEERWREYREAGRRFLASAGFEIHHEANVAGRWLEWLEDASR